MSEKPHPILVLQELATAWGRPLRQVPSISYEDIAPFSSRVGILSDLTVVYLADADWPEVIHEMGHVFAMPEYPCDDESDFFGWEWLMALKVARDRADIGDWHRSMRNYSIKFMKDRSSDDYGFLPGTLRAAALRVGVQRGRRVGNVVGREPICVRFGPGVPSSSPAGHARTPQSPEGVWAILDSSGVGGGTMLHACLKVGL